MTVTAKRKFQMTVDFAMIIILPTLMAYEMIGTIFHEWVGSFMFILFIVHNLMNYKWYKSMFKGKYTPYRKLSTLINIMLFVIMISLMVSGIILSKHIFSFLNINFGIAVARVIHILGAYWGYVLMSVHIGLHCNKISKLIKCNKIILKILKIIIYAICVYGVYAFVVRQIGSYMFMQNQFVFFDFSESIIKFILDYFAIMILFAVIGNYLAVRVKKYRVY
jgi:hypothetical protein